MGGRSQQGRKRRNTPSCGAPSRADSWRGHSSECTRFAPCALASREDALHAISDRMSPRIFGSTGAQQSSLRRGVKCGDRMHQDRPLDAEVQARIPCEVPRAPTRERVSAPANPTTGPWPHPSRAVRGPRFCALIRWRTSSLTSVTFPSQRPHVSTTIAAIATTPMLSRTKVRTRYPRGRQPAPELTPCAATHSHSCGGAHLFKYSIHNSRVISEIVRSSWDARILI